MRENKFRVWNTYEKWPGKRMSDPFTLFGRRITWDGKSLMCAMEDLVPMQFIGLHDKNGKEIYDGDIVKADWHWDGSLPHVIEWPGDIYNLREYALEENNIEVLGNIYENPELLTIKP